MILREKNSDMRLKLHQIIGCENEKKKGEKKTIKYPSIR